MVYFFTSLKKKAKKIWKRFESAHWGNLDFWMVVRITLTLQQFCLWHWFLFSVPVECKVLRYKFSVLIGYATKNKKRKTKRRKPYSLVKFWKFKIWGACTAFLQHQKFSRDWICFIVWKFLVWNVFIRN